MSEPKPEGVHPEVTTFEGNPGKKDASIAPVEVDEVEYAYRLSFRTVLVLICMGVTWGTCTMANVGPSTTYQYAVNQVGGASIGSWIPNAALIPLIGLQPIWGSLADRFGKKWFIVAGGLAGIAGNITAGSASSTGVIISGQVINGIGASLLLLVIPAGMEIVPAKQRGFAQGLMGTVNGIMAILALIISGVFSKTSSSGWRWVYYFNAIFFGASGLLILALYQPPPTRLLREQRIGDLLRSIDFLGIALLLCSVVGLVMSLTWGGHTYPWNSSRVVSLLVLGVAFLVGFCIYESVGRRDGLIDHRFLESRNFLLIMSVSFLDGMLLYGVNAFLPSQAAALFSTDPVIISLYLLPLNILVVFGILGSAYVLGALKRYRLLLVLSVVLIAVFCGLLALVTPSRLAMMLVFTGLIGLGVGVTSVIPVVIMSYAVPSHMIGTAGTLLASFRALGGTTGITIFAAIHDNYLSANFVESVAAAVIKAGLPATSAQEFAIIFQSGATTNLGAIDGVTSNIIAAAKEASQMVSVHAFRYIWIANAAVGVITGLFTLFLQPVKHKMTTHIESPLEPEKKQSLT